MEDTPAGTLVAAASSDLQSPAKVLLESEFGGADSYVELYTLPTLSVSAVAEPRAEVERNIALRQPVVATTFSQPNSHLRARSSRGTGAACSSNGTAESVGRWPWRE